MLEVIIMNDQEAWQISVEKLDAKIGFRIHLNIHKSLGKSTIKERMIEK